MVGRATPLGAKANDRDYRAEVVEAIRGSCDVLYEDEREVRDLEDFFAEALS